MVEGEYPGANNRQDDLAQIATGAAVRGDEDTAGAIALANGASANGVVTRSTDVDAYAFTAAGSTTITVANGTPFPDLDVQLRVLNSVGRPGRARSTRPPPGSRPPRPLA